MKRVTIIATLLSFALIYGCTSSKNIGTTSLPDPKSDNTEVAEPKADKKSSKSSQKGVVIKENTTIGAESSEASDPQPTTTKNSKTTTEKVVVKEENVKIIQEVGSPVEPGKYYVIMGSFRVIENAQSFKTHLITERYNPILLQNDEGLYRVAVGAYLQEAPAREKINTIRTQSDKYNDVWLLIQKN